MKPDLLILILADIPFLFLLEKSVNVATKLLSYRGCLQHPPCLSQSF